MGVVEGAGALAESDFNALIQGGLDISGCHSCLHFVEVTDGDADRFQQFYNAVVRSGCHLKDNKVKCLALCETESHVDEVVQRLAALGIPAKGLHAQTDRKNKAAA